jgi:hypothetical protein
MFPVLFALVLFPIGCPVYAWASLDPNPPIYVPHIAGLIGVHYYTQLLLVEMGSC